MAKTQKKKPTSVKSKSVKYHGGNFPPRDIDWSRLIPLIGPASAALARYDGLLEAIPNASILLSPLTMREAVLSSRIEGTQATMGDVFEYEAGKETTDPAKLADIMEVRNYRKAMQHALELLDKLPLCRRVILKAHSILLEGVRGHDKARGKFRTIQNFIGKPGCSIEEARFVPISAENVAEGMSCWEKFIHAGFPDKLVKLAVAHAEFEALHPFLDGNGRVGRMLIPLYLFETRLLHSPMFYVSEYLERHRQEYYDRLLAVSRDNDWTGWCEFFLTAMKEQAEKNETTARRILKLYESKKQFVADVTRSQYSIAVLDFIFKQPVFNSPAFTKATKISETTTRRILQQLSGAGTLKISYEAKGRHSAVYIFSELLNIAEGREVF